LPDSSVSKSRLSRACLLCWSSVSRFRYFQSSATKVRRLAARDHFLNAPFVIAAVTVFGSLIWLLVAADVAGDEAERDVQTRMHPLTDTAPVSKADYLEGRFLAALVLNARHCPAAILLELAVLYLPSTAMYNAAM
jgi:hypothetical protein